jgi:hypothetical protein
MRETKEELSDAPKKTLKKPKTADAGIDSQQEFIKNIQSKLENEYLEKLTEKEKEIRKLDIQLEKMKMNEYNLDEYQAQRIRALTKVMQEVMKDNSSLDRQNIAKLFGLDDVIKEATSKIQPSSAPSEEVYNHIQREFSDKLDQERREFRTREREVEQKAYDKARQEFEIESRKLELDRRQKEIEDQKLRDKEFQQKLKDDKQIKQKRLSVGSNINPVSIAPSPEKKKSELKFLNLAEKKIEKPDQSGEDIEEDIYSESFEDDSKKSDKKDISELEESKVTDRPPKGKPSIGQRLINKYGNDLDEEIDGSATLDFNLTKTESMLDSLPLPLTTSGKGRGKLSKETKAEREAKIARLTKSKDPFSSYVREQPEEDEDEIGEEPKK